MKAVRERDRDKERHRERERESFSSAVMPIMSYLYQRGRVAHNSDNLNQQHWGGNCGKIDPSPPTTPAPYVVLFTSSRREGKEKQPTMECRLQFVVCLKSSWYFKQCNWCQVLVWKKKEICLSRPDLVQSFKVTLEGISSRETIQNAWQPERKLCLSESSDHEKHHSILHKLADYRPTLLIYGHKCEKQKGSHLFLRGH